jgi:hemoglobin
MQIQEKPPAGTPFEWIGGEEKVQALVERFYDLMDLEPAYAQLRAAHGTEPGQRARRLFWFLCGWLGGPQHYTDRFGHPMLRARHMPQAIQDRHQGARPVAGLHGPGDGRDGVPDDLRERLRGSFFQTADWMRNGRARACTWSAKRPVSRTTGRRCPRPF